MLAPSSRSASCSALRTRRQARDNRALSLAARNRSNGPPMPGQGRRCGGGCAIAACGPLCALFLRERVEILDADVRRPLVDGRIDELLDLERILREDRLNLRLVVDAKEDAAALAWDER